MRREPDYCMNVYRVQGGQWLGTYYFPHELSAKTAGQWGALYRLKIYRKNPVAFIVAEAQRLDLP